MMPFADVQKYLPAPPGDGPLAAEDTVAGEHQGLLPPAPISQSISSCKTAEGSLTPSETAQQMLKNPQIQNENPENAVTVPLLSVSRAVRSQVTYQDDVEADGRHWFRRLQQYSCLIYWVFMLMFAIFLCYYFYEILIAREPRLGKLEPQPGNTNLIVAVLCQVFGALMLWLYLDLFNALQLQLLSRPKGVLLLEAEQLSQSTGLFGTLQMCLIPGRHRKWTLQRYGVSNEYFLEIQC
jgi:hypothetical protein